ncbi:hypothetical protein Pelo_8923 [Pelomyxa schiedti]|nr:hypothetical protein Pelo_8923 [Pelomyxa schiedti]
MSTAGLVVSADDARNKIAALACASNARCGSRSPAAPVARDAPLMLGLWRRLWSRGPRLSVLAVTRDPVTGTTAASLVSFGVSRLLLGVTGAVARELWDCATEWVNSGPTFFLSTDCVAPAFSELAVGHMKEVLVVPCEDPLTTTFTPQILKTMGGWFRCHPTDGRWWVWCNGTVMVIEDLLLCPGEDQQEKSFSGSSGRSKAFDVIGGVGEYECLGDVKPGRCFHSIVCGRPGEAILVFNNRAGELPTYLVTINLSQTRLNRRISVVSILSVPHRYFSSLVMKKTSSGGDYYTLVLQEDQTGPQSMAPIVEIDLDTGEAIVPLVTKGEIIGRLSASLFCVSHNRRGFEVWDCNTLTQPLRTVSEDCQMLYGSGGFVFEVCRGNRVRVTEAYTGHHIPGDCFDAGPAAAPASSDI